jgi:DNA-binding SARP family transcriptional activator
MLALLAYVALEGRTSRASLAALFWPEHDANRSRRNLRRELHRRREAGLAAAVDGQADGLWLAPGVVTDVSLFEEAIASKDLGQALALYRGPFLDGLVLGDAGGFDNWAAARRERLSQRFRQAVEAQVTVYEAAGHWREALRAALGEAAPTAGVLASGVLEAPR